MIADQVECVVRAESCLGEGPLWLAGTQSLLWVDIVGQAVHRSKPSGETRTTYLSEAVGVVVPRRTGGFIAATQSGIRILDIETGELSTIAAPVSMIDRRFNDGKCDPVGRFWAGTVALGAASEKSALYRLDADHSIAEIESGFGLCNGLGWSPEGDKFYLVDSRRQVIYVYRFDASLGRLFEKVAFVSFERDGSMPDGLAIDADGCVWCAMWKGWSVKRFTPEGILDRTVALPVPCPTSCAFGGPDLKTLFITSARLRLKTEQLANAPLSGSVFAVQLTVSGIPTVDYVG